MIDNLSVIISQVPAHSFHYFIHLCIFVCVMSQKQEMESLRDQLQQKDFELAKVLLHLHPPAWFDIFKTCTFPVSFSIDPVLHV